MRELFVCVNSFVLFRCVYRRHGMEQCIMYDGHDRRCAARTFI